MEVKVKFFIDDGMALGAIEYLLSIGNRVSKKAIIEECKLRLKGHGERFEIEPDFDNGTEYWESDKAEELYHKYWKI